MSTIVTTRTYQQGDNFTFTIAAKNGYGIKVSEIPSMAQYLNDESIDSLGDMFPGLHNYGLYPAVTISGQLNNISVNYNVTLENDSCRQLQYMVKFNGGTDPTTGNPVIISNPPEEINPYYWSPNPLTLITPTIDGESLVDPDSVQFVTWHCLTDGNDYVAGSRVYVNNDLNFMAVWQPAPVSVGVESDTESSTVPEFENE